MFITEEVHIIARGRSQVGGVWENTRSSLNTPHVRSHPPDAAVSIAINVVFLVWGFSFLKRFRGAILHALLYNIFLYVKVSQALFHVVTKYSLGRYFSGCSVFLLSLSMSFPFYVFLHGMYC